MQRLSLFFVVSILALASLGCPSGPKEEQIAIKSNNAVQQAKDLLQNYAKGQPLGSEASNFNRIAADAVKEDPAKGAIVEKALKDIEANQSNRAAIAKGALEKL
ncbi:MAG: hypothetical protein K2X38_10250 [Gemmataceae bacterium]|nr:hypothetical protein [Gemmataceae bacterium]